MASDDPKPREAISYSDDKAEKVRKAAKKTQDNKASISGITYGRDAITAADLSTQIKGQKYVQPTQEQLVEMDIAQRQVATKEYTDNKPMMFAVRKIRNALVNNTAVVEIGKKLTELDRKNLNLSGKIKSVVRSFKGNDDREL